MPFLGENHFPVTRHMSAKFARFGQYLFSENKIGIVPIGSVSAAVFERVVGYLHGRIPFRKPFQSEIHLLCC